MGQVDLWVWLLLGRPCRLLLPFFCFVVQCGVIQPVIAYWVFFQRSPTWSPGCAAVCSEYAG